MTPRNEQQGAGGRFRGIPPKGVLAALVADNAPERLRGTAFGLFNLVSGISLLLASAGAGLLWDGLGPQAPFYASAVIAGLALLAWSCRSRVVRP